jgi:hypothetical protein
VSVAHSKIARMPGRSTQSCRNISFHQPKTLCIEGQLKTLPRLFDVVPLESKTKFEVDFYHLENSETITLVDVRPEWRRAVMARGIAVVPLPSMSLIYETTGNVVGWITLDYEDIPSEGLFALLLMTDFKEGFPRPPEWYREHFLVLQQSSTNPGKYQRVGVGEGYSLIDDSWFEDAPFQECLIE